MARLSIKGEARDTRMVALVTATTYNNMKKVATVQRIPMNSIINDLIIEFIENHQGDIERYNAFFGEE